MATLLEKKEVARYHGYCMCKNEGIGDQTTSRASNLSFVMATVNSVAVTIPKYQ